MKVYFYFVKHKARDLYLGKEGTRLFPETYETRDDAVAVIREVAQVREDWGVFSVEADTKSISELPVSKHE